MEKLNLTQEWDKVFLKSDKVDHKKVTFHNRYGITLAADMYTPKSVVDKLPAIAVSGPFLRGKGAVLRSVCAENGRAWLLDDCLRSVLHRRRAAVHPATSLRRTSTPRISAQR